ncbi:hypothetical protein NKH77_00975 [Streptomyces sp. M19]
MDRGVDEAIRAVEGVGWQCCGSSRGSVPGAAQFRTHRLTAGNGPVGLLVRAARPSRTAGWPDSPRRGH